MCGITGFVESVRGGGSLDLKKVALDMADALHHRGPDAKDVWIDERGVALAHTRLSILDLSTNGGQPMASETGRYVLVFNGEIYNHLDLRKELAKDEWRGHSDTETFLAACEAWGIQAALTRSVGMFAIALWDNGERSLTLARDRFGEKPLFYGWQGGSFIFGSELKSLTKHPKWQGVVDRDSLVQYLRYGYVPLPRSIWRGVKKLLPGSFLNFPLDTLPGVSPKPIYYWRARDLANAPILTRWEDKEASDELDLRLSQTISNQMVADVPLGAFLSGGVDSSLVVAVMQALSPMPVNTYTIGFSETDYNEAEYAKAVAAHLGTSHTELYLSSADAMDVIPRLAQMYDEPFGDASQIPTHLVAALARKHVKVSLSGDGGDEIFGGYNRHILGPSLWAGLSKFPIGIRRIVAQCITAVSPSQWDQFGRLLPSRFRQPMFGDRTHKLASIMTALSADEVYKWLVSHERNPESVVLRSREDRDAVGTWAQREMALMQRDDFSERMMFSDQVGYLIDDILCKIDRSAMAASLETRVPFLDHRIVEFAWGLPTNMKIRDGQGKWLLRQVLYRYVPKNLIERPKQGFGVPIDSWLRGPLRDWAEDLLDESRLRREGYFDPGPVRQKWDEHLSGRRNWQYWLWNVLMFQAWRESWDS
jgi:asparagine synthase (glutamine-hydrolysing)